MNMYFVNSAVYSGSMPLAGFYPAKAKSTTTTTTITTTTTKAKNRIFNTKS